MASRLKTECQVEPRCLARSCLDHTHDRLFCCSYSFPWHNVPFAFLLSSVSASSLLHQLVRSSFCVLCEEWAFSSPSALVSALVCSVQVLRPSHHRTNLCRRPLLSPAVPPSFRACAQRAKQSIAVLIPKHPVHMAPRQRVRASVPRCPAVLASPVFCRCCIGASGVGRRSASFDTRSPVRTATR